MDSQAHSQTNDNDDIRAVFSEPLNARLDRIANALAHAGIHTAQAAADKQAVLKKELGTADYYLVNLLLQDLGCKISIAA